MAIIRIERKKQFINILRDYQIYINGQIAGTLSNGETQDFIIHPGQHTLVAKIDWCKSQEFQIMVEENQIQKIKVGSFKFADQIIACSLLLSILKLFTNNLFLYNLVFISLSIVFVLAIYVMTIGRSHYLRLDLEDEGKL
jgi:hypothetical protein